MDDDALDMAVRLVAAGMSQSDAATALGLSQSTVSAACIRAGIRIGRGRGRGAHRDASRRAQAGGWATLIEEAI